MAVTGPEPDSEDGVLVKSQTYKNAFNISANNHYLITDEGRLIDFNDRVLFDFGLNQPSSLYVSDNLLIAATFEGKIKMLYRDILFNNVLQKKNRQCANLQVALQQFDPRRKMPFSQFLKTTNAVSSFLTESTMGKRKHSGKHALG